MKVFKFGGASVKDAAGVREIEKSGVWAFLLIFTGRKKTVRCFIQWLLYCS